MSKPSGLRTRTRSQSISGPIIGIGGDTSKAKTKNDTKSREKEDGKRRTSGRLQPSGHEAPNIDTNALYVPLNAALAIALKTEILDTDIRKQMVPSERVSVIDEAHPHLMEFSRILQQSGLERPANAYRLLLTFWQIATEIPSTLVKDEWLGWRPKLSDVKRDIAKFEPYGPDAQSIHPPMSSSSKNRTSTPLKPALRTRSIRSLESQVGDPLSLSLSEPRVHFTPPSKAKTRATSKGTGNGNNASTPETPTRRLIMDSVMVPRRGSSESPLGVKRKRVGEGEGDSSRNLMLPLVSSSKQIRPKPRPPPKRPRLASTTQTQGENNDEGGPNSDSDAEDEDEVQDALAGLIDTDVDSVIDDGDDNEMLSPRTVIPKGKRKTRTRTRTRTSAASVQDALLPGPSRSMRFGTSGSGSRPMGVASNVDSGVDGAQSEHPSNPFFDDTPHKLSFRCLTCVSHGDKNCTFSGWNERCNNCKLKKRGNCTFKYSSVKEDKEAARESSWGTVDDYRSLLTQTLTLDSAARAAAQSARTLFEARDREVNEIRGLLERDLKDFEGDLGFLDEVVDGFGSDEEGPVGVGGLLKGMIEWVKGRGGGGGHGE
ncbi:hypothetical protein VKT23_014718 [Stygiomarasmius scandens]|uniref:Uncharacterized protein n=1 Tax=Marasmiellus scandens TaxID=2682957 RepID=A0ABR1J0Z3_9AGAR